MVGVTDPIKGEVPFGLCVLSDGSIAGEDQVCAEAIAAVRHRVGPIATPRTVLAVRRLPKTRSGKILRGVIRKIANGEYWTVPPTIDDSAVLDEIAAALATTGLPVQPVEAAQNF